MIEGNRKCEGPDHEAAELSCHFALLFQFALRKAGNLALTHTPPQQWFMMLQLPSLLLGRFVEIRGAIETKPCRARTKKTKYSICFLA